jgi:hypothetical protein
MITQRSVAATKYETVLARQILDIEMAPLLGYRWKSQNTQLPGGRHGYFYTTI